MPAYRQALPKRGTGKHHVMGFALSLILSMTCVRAVAQELPKVAVLSTGGTIASRQDPVKGERHLESLPASTIIATRSRGRYVMRPGDTLWPKPKELGRGFGESIQLPLMIRE
jgi:hypothetical protein